MGRFPPSGRCVVRTLPKPPPVKRPTADLYLVGGIPKEAPKGQIPLLARRAPPGCNAPASYVPSCLFFAFVECDPEALTSEGRRPRALILAPARAPP